LRTLYFYFLDICYWWERYCYERSWKWRCRV